MVPHPRIPTSPWKNPIRPYSVVASPIEPSLLMATRIPGQSPSLLRHVRCVTAPHVLLQLIYLCVSFSGLWADWGQGKSLQDLCIPGDQDGVLCEKVLDRWFVQWMNERGRVGTETRRQARVWEGGSGLSWIGMIRKARCWNALRGFRTRRNSQGLKKRAWSIFFFFFFVKYTIWER